MQFVYVMYLISSSGMSVVPLPNASMNFAVPQMTSINSFKDGKACIDSAAKMNAADAEALTLRHFYVCMSYVYPSN